MSAHLTDKSKVVLLCDEWGSSKGGLSTFNRHLAIHLAKRSTLDVICYLLDVSVDDLNAAKVNCVTLIKAKSIPGSSDPFASQYRLPTELSSVDVIISHGRKFGCSAYLIKDKLKSCKWIHFVHVDCKEMGQNKAGFDEIGANNKKDRNELDLCNSADVTVVVGPRLLERYRKILPKKPVIVFYPGLSIEFKNPDPNYESKEGDGRNDFQIYIFGRCSVEDFELKGFDIAAKAVGKLAEHYKLNIVGVPEGEEENIRKHTLDTTGLKKSQLFVGTYCKDREEMKAKMCEADVVIMPSRAEAFGLVGLEALTFGVPLLVSAASGLGMTLMELNFGHTFVVDSHDSQEWAARIESMKKNKRSQRVKEVIQMRNQYEEKYKWEDQCESLIKLFFDD